MLPLSLRRLRYQKRVAGTTLAACWQAPSKSTGKDWRQASYLVCDAEMSSLEVSSGELLSLGWVLLREGSICLDSARHLLVSPERSVGQSAAIHQLRDCELADGGDSAALLQAFLDAAAGNVLVFHHAPLDLAYLDRLCLEHCGAPLLMPVVDTLALERRRLARRDQPIGSGELRLQACRERYGLPDYPAHNALVDALATAELLLAQASHGLDIRPA